MCDKKITKWDSSRSHFLRSDQFTLFQKNYDKCLTTFVSNCDLSQKETKKKHAQPTPQPPTPGCRSVRSRPTLSPSHPVLSALRPRSRFPNTIRFGSRPPLIRMSAPAHKQSLLVRHVVSMLSHQVISRAQLYFALSLPDLPGAVNFFNSFCLSLLPGCFPAGAGPSPEEVKRG